MSIGFGLDAELAILHVVLLYCSSIVLQVVSLGQIIVCHVLVFDIIHVLVFVGRQCFYSCVLLQHLVSHGFLSFGVILEKGLFYFRAVILN